MIFDYLSVFNNNKNIKYIFAIICIQSVISHAGVNTYGFNHDPHIVYGQIKNPSECLRHDLYRLFILTYI